ncbi:MAG: hypothetical protein CVU11_08805 [Bacteroidetes bacterium HGW-Bacteroidetes-6]|jgi:hypothetical protein|nr:MAG: hypothetical protein CVU11_08805 [Bacteroidetes bacterium HGW-Bacteroidetes-6]
MSAKITLDFVAYSDIAVLAVCAPMRDYRFIWHINNDLQYSFAQEPPFSWFHKKLKADYEFALFTCPNHEDIVILSNRNENVLLVPKLATVDFFIVFTDSADPKEVALWKNTLQKIQGVTLITQLQGKQLDDFQTILSDIEAQETERKKAEKQERKGF